MTNKEKFLKLVSAEETDTVRKNQQRIRSRAMLRESQQVAMKVIVRLEELGWTQRDLAAQMEVSPQQVNKIISGKENMTLETLVKLQEILNIPILATFFANQPVSAAKHIIRFRTTEQALNTTPTEAGTFRFAAKQALHNIPLNAGSTYSTNADND